MKFLNLIILLSTFSVLVFGISMTTLVYGQEDRNTTDHAPKFFAIQHAQSGLISEINETVYSLELNDVSDKTLLFSDRPDRIVKSVTTSDFIGNWYTGEDSFAVDTPNTVLVVDERKGTQQDIAIIELFNPVYDSNKKALQYDITLDNATSIDLQSEFGQTTLVIDIIQSPCPTGPDTC